MGYNIDKILQSYHSKEVSDSQASLISKPLYLKEIESSNSDK